MSGNRKTASKSPKSSNKSEPFLKNWSNWNEEWGKVQRKISQKVHLPSGDLLMNYSERIREVNEEKMVLDYAKIPTTFDKYRGKPDFYKLPDALAKKSQCRCLHCCCCRFRGECCCVSNEPTYFTVKSKKERFIVPPVDLVGVPDRIRKEKHILNGTRNIYKKWRDGSYRKKQMVRLADKIQNIVPHWPHFEHLSVIGRKMPGETATKSPDISNETKNIQPSKSRSVIISVDLPNENPRLSLKLNGILLEHKEGTVKIRIFFQHDISSSDVSVDYLNFFNPGSAALRLAWKPLKKYRVFANYTKEKCPKFGFSFCKKELHILPGRVKKVPVWFTSESSGHFTESWELLTRPTIWDESCRVIVILQSYAYDKKLKKKLAAMVKYIDQESNTLMIRDILHECLNNAKYVAKPTAICVFGEAELFEVANLFNEHPVYIFDKVLVESLKDLYERVRPEEKKWNYSVSYLRQLAHKKDVNIYGENKLKEIEERIRRIESEKVNGKLESKDAKGKKSKENVKKDSEKKGSEKKDKAKKSKSSSKVVESEKIEPEEMKAIKKEPYEYSNQQELWKIVRQLDSPVIINTKRQKYFACYEILEAYFTQMCHKLDSLKYKNNFTRDWLFPATKSKLVPINEQPDRLIYEYFEHHYVPLHSVDYVYPFEVKRKPKSLREISNDDVEAIYSTYFNKSVGSKNKGKSKQDLTKKSKDDKSKKGKSKEDVTKKSKKDKSKKGKSKEDVTKKDAKTKKSKQKLHTLSKEKIPKEVSIVSFNPYAEDFVYVAEAEAASPVVEKQPEKRKTNREMYKYEQYLIVYSGLSEAVEALVDAIESFDCVVSFPALTEVKPQFPDDEEHQK